MPVDATIPDPSSADDPTWKADHLDPWILDTATALNAHGLVIDEFPGATDTAKLEAAIAAAVAADNGTVIAAARTYSIGSLVTFPDGVNLWGAGTGKSAGSTTRFLMTAAGAGLQFGDVADPEVPTFGDATRGGLNGNFEVDGGDVATTPLRIVFVVHRTFSEIDVRNAASGGAGCWLNHVQNCVFTGLTVDDCAGDGLVLDTSSNGNTFITPRLSACGTAAGTNLANLKFTSTQVPLFGAGQGFPQHNAFYNVMIEVDGGNLAAQVWYGAGLRNWMSGNITATGDESAIRTNIDNATDAPFSARLHITQCEIFGAGTADVPAFDLAQDTELSIDDGVNAYNWSSLYRLRGAASFVTHTAAIEEQTIGSILHASSVGTHAGNISTTFRNRIYHAAPASADVAIMGLVRGEAGYRWDVRADGTLTYGDGTGWSPDVLVGRVAANLWGSLDDGDSIKAGSGAWNAGHLQMGAYHLWIDATGDLRIKSSAPSSDTDGTVVGTQS
jgi:hypothetical protein